LAPPYEGGEVLFLTAPIKTGWHGRLAREATGETPVPP
jgi:hypothetical protein